MSINRSAASVTTKNAVNIAFDQTLSPQVGAATAAQIAVGVLTPNVQAALDQIWHGAMTQPGQVIVTLSSRNPNLAPTSSSSQVSVITVTGTPTTGNLSIMGYTVAILSTDTTTQIATKIRAVLVAVTSVFASVVASTNTVTVTFVDTTAHMVDNNVQLGLTIATTTTTFGGTPGYLGYGWWELLGSETKYTRTFYSWLRIA
jgi:hypothetical protein